MIIFYTTQFKRDYKRIKKQQKKLIKLRTVIEILASGNQLPPIYNDHPLSGRWKGHRDCHIESDWILIYRLTGDSLFFERTGSHSD